MLNDDKVYFSESGLEELKKKLEYIKTSLRVEIARQLEYAKSLGDLSENAEYQQAKEEQMINEVEIQRLEDIFSRAVVISNKRDNSAVTVGSTVCVEDGKSLNCKFTIVGSEEADPKVGKISNESPLGKAFLGKARKDKVCVTTPKGNIEYTIIDIA